MFISCEDEEDSTAKLTIANKDFVTYTVYINEQSIGTANANSSTTFTISPECSDIKITGNNKSTTTSHCFTENEQFTFEVNLIPATISFYNKDECSYKCNYDGKYLGSVSFNDTAIFEIEAKNRVEVFIESTDCTFTNETLIISTKEDENYLLTIDIYKD
jgi:hypothetical protein